MEGGGEKGVAVMREGKKWDQNGCEAWVTTELTRARAL